MDGAVVASVCEGATSLREIREEILADLRTDSMVDW